MSIVFVMSLLRFAFIPLFMMCNVNPYDRSSSFPVVFESDAAYIVLMVLFSISNGYIASMSMMSAPQV
jgi:equilibrative nucleoside transporter 1/2/3